MLRSILLGKKAQSTAEYAILLTLVVAAALAMQTYVKRGLNARTRDVVKDTTIGGRVDTAGIFTGGQYEPYYLASDVTQRQNSNNDENMAENGAVTREGSSGTQTTRTNQILGPGYEGAAK